jgi:hypothetical protein
MCSPSITLAHRPPGQVARWAIAAFPISCASQGISGRACQGSEHARANRGYFDEMQAQAAHRAFNDAGGADVRGYGAAA